VSERRWGSLTIAGLVVILALTSSRVEQGTGPWAQVACHRAALRTVAVDTVGELEDALATAEPGDLIVVADGEYTGTFELTSSGSAVEPIELCAEGGAVLDGGTMDTGYVLHITGDRWIVRGFVLRNANKGIVLDGAQRNVLDNLVITHLGQEGVHFRTHSIDNVLRDSWIHDTGNLVARFGEGVYVGSATSNWCRYTDCQPDRSDRNVVEGNRLGPDVTAEGVDVKEGTAGTVIRNNRFLGDGMTAADAWVDIKGNSTIVVGNHGTDSRLNGFEVNVEVRGWGQGNVFEGNTADLNASGVGFLVDPSATGTLITCTTS
jgi:hypothetical protein